MVKLLGKPWLENGKWHIPLEFVFGEDLETAIFNVQKSKIQVRVWNELTLIELETMQSLLLICC